MYTIYADGELLYAPYLFHEGYGVTSPKLTVELNKAGSLEFTMPSTNPRYNDVKKLKSIITVFQNREEMFRGRILQEEKDYWKQKKMYCEGELAFLLDSKQRPYVFSGTVKELFYKYINGHNARVEAAKKFTVGNVTIPEANNSIALQNENYSTTWDELNTNILENVGGYLKIRGSGSTRYIDLLEKSGVDSGQLIEFGTNLLDLSEHITAEDVFTVLIPLGATITTEEEGDIETRLTIALENNGKDYLEDATAISLFGRIEKTQEWDEVESDDELIKLGKNYLSNNIKMAVTLSVKAVDMHLLDVNVEQIHVGDWVRVLSLPHELDSWFQCTKIVYDLASPDQTEYTFGYSFYSLTDHQVNTKKNMQGTLVIAGGGYVKTATFGAYQNSVNSSMAVMQSDIDRILAMLGNGEVPSGYTLLNYIESNGTQYIDTGVGPLGAADVRKLKVTFDAAFLDSTEAIFGHGNTYIGFYGSGLPTVYAVASGKTTDTTHTYDANRHTFVLDCVNLIGSIDGNTTSLTAKETAMDTPFYLFGWRSDYRNKARLWSCKIEYDGSLIRDFVPCRNSDGVCGLYDKVNKQFYSDAAGGSFTGG